MKLPMTMPLTTGYPRFIIAVLVLLSYLGISSAYAQNHKFNSAEIDPAQVYLFYLHGGIVQEVGPGAVSAYYGKYEYYAIVDSLADLDCEVVSEVRAKGTKEEMYAKMLAGQIDTLLRAGVPPEHIVIVGASLGAYIAVECSMLLKNVNVKYALLGLCSEFAVGYYRPRHAEIYGNFLSIYEVTDEKKSCAGIFFERSGHFEFREVALNMGNSHAFLYKPYRDWIEPLAAWMAE